MRKILICVLILLISCNVLHAEEDLTGLSLEECLELALINHPSLRRAKSSTRDIKAQLESLKANDRVKITLTGSANYSGTYQYWDDRTHAENLSINATKLLYDTGKNKLQKQIRNESLQGSIETERNTQITVAANAKRAYYDLVLKLLNRDVEREKLNNLEQHLKTAQGFYDVGQSPFIDVT
ncbi:MAG: TolC family protein, partial [Synergistaceae bacterium]|nr:TolC family protein [Synergistaceae bacterium]